MRYLGNYDDFIRDQVIRAQKLGITRELLEKLRTRNESQTLSKSELLKST